eukprot:g32649.t1
MLSVFDLSSQSQQAETWPSRYSFVAASPQLGAIVAPVLWGVAYTWSERLVQVLVPLGDFLGQLVLALGIAMVDSDSPALESQAVLTAGLLIFSVARAGVGVVQHAAMARLLHGKRQDQASERPF